VKWKGKQQAAIQATCRVGAFLPQVVQERKAVLNSGHQQDEWALPTGCTRGPSSASNMSCRQRLWSVPSQY
jgi:hypothetical protein